MNFTYIINACSLVADKTHDRKINELTEFLRSSLSENNKPVISLLSFAVNQSECCNLVSLFLRMDISSELRDMINDNDNTACIILDYSDECSLLSLDGDDNTIIYGLPSEKLKTQRIAIITSVISPSRWLELSDELDTVCLLVNATMAMNQTERTWLEKFAKYAYSDGNLYIAFTKMNILNTEDDAVQVRSMAGSFLNKHNIRAQILQEPEKALDIMQGFIRGHDIKNFHDCRVSRLVLRAIAERARYFIDEVLIDDSSISNALTQLEKQKKSLEISGQAVADGMLKNCMNGLMIEVCEAIRDYNSQISESITSYIAKASAENLRDIDEKINSYINGTWEEYFSSKTGEIKKRISDITSKLMEQMNIDAGDLISNLDEQTRRTIYAALNLEAPFITEDAYSRIKHSSGDISLDDITDRLKRETRNMMLLSIPLLFVNPLISAGNILAAKVIEKFRMSDNLNAMRSEMKSQVENLCFEVVEDIIRLTQNSFNEEMDRASESVKSAYGGLIKHIEGNILKLQTERDKRTEARYFLEKQLRETYPALEAELTSAVI